MSLFDHEDAETIGSVTGVDTGTVVVQVEDEDQLRRLQVNHLVVLRSGRAGQHLVGIISKIMRKALLTNSSDPEENGEGLEDLATVENVVTITLVGTLLDRLGSKANVFRRTLESVPEIDAPCFSLEGERLTRFMQAIGTTATEGAQAVHLGTYTLDENAKAWLDGNRFLQRHAVVVGGTGSGKSWTVARILEEAAELPMSNAVLFDIHGEYEPLTSEGFRHFRIAGPADEDRSSSLEDGVIHLELFSKVVDRVGCRDEKGGASFRVRPIT